MAARGLHKLLIVGGGAGGLELITGLGYARGVGLNKNVQWMLLDGRPTHIWKPLLHEVATGSFNSGQDELNYFSHSSDNNYHFTLGWMGGLDKDKKVVKVDELKVGGKILCAPREIPYDTLVMAIGSVADTFGTPGARQHCMFLNNAVEADELRLAILIQGISVLYGATKVPKLRIGIVGGGATGVELAAEIHHTIEELSMTGFQVEQLETTILEAAPKILGMADEKLSQFATEELEKKNVQIRTNCRIKCVTDKGFEMADGTLVEKEIRVWTAGIRAPRWVAKQGIKTNTQSRIMCNEYLQSLDDPNIFAMGDVSCVPVLGNSALFLPPTAQVAHQQANWLRNYLQKRIESTDGRIEGVAPFKYVPQGFLVSLGHHTAVGSMALMRGMQDYQVKGYVAKGLYITLYRKHQASIFGYPKMLSLWIGDQFRNIAMPELKFH